MYTSFWNLLSLTTAVVVSTTPCMAGVVVRRAEVDINAFGPVTCAPVANLTGRLMMRGSSLDSPVPLSMTDDRGLAEIDDAAQAVSFIFESCKALVMGSISDPAKGLYYGHLKFSDNQTQCLRSDPRWTNNTVDPQAITRAPCNFEENNFQYYQFWLANLTDTTAPPRIDFVGVPGEDIPFRYNTGLRGDEGSRVANVNGTLAPWDDTLFLSLSTSPY